MIASRSMSPAWAMPAPSSPATRATARTTSAGGPPRPATAGAPPSAPPPSRGPLGLEVPLASASIIVCLASCRLAQPSATHNCHPACRSPAGPVRSPSRRGARRETVGRCSCSPMVWLHLSLGVLMPPCEHGRGAAEGWSGMAAGEVEQGPWLTLSEAASRSGLHREALRARAKRGQLPSRRGNTGQVLVQLPPDLLNPAHGAAQGVAQAQVEQLAEVIHDLEHELGELRERLSAGGGGAGRHGTDGRGRGASVAENWPRCGPSGTGRQDEGFGWNGCDGSSGWCGRCGCGRGKRRGLNQVPGSLPRHVQASCYASGRQGGSVMSSTPSRDRANPIGSDTYRANHGYRCQPYLSRYSCNRAATA